MTALSSLGGAIWGSLAGIVGGALLGTLFGVFLGDLSLGLDGALLGGGGLALGGAIFGVVLGAGEPPSPPLEEEAPVAVGERW